MFLKRCWDPLWPGTCQLHKGHQWCGSWLPWDTVGQGCRADWAALLGTGKVWQDEHKGQRPLWFHRISSSQKKTSSFYSASVNTTSAPSSNVLNQDEGMLDVLEHFFVLAIWWWNIFFNMGKWTNSYFFQFPCIWSWFFFHMWLLESPMTKFLQDICKFNTCK